MTDDPRKPLGGKAYGSIPHLSGSRLGPGEHHCHEGQERICTVATRDKHDRVWVQDKLDGSCVAAALLDGKVLALSRAGYLATTSPFAQHWFWAWWVAAHEERFRATLEEGERLVGELLVQAHGRVYRNLREPFVPFDVMRGTERLPMEQFNVRRDRGWFDGPATWLGPMPVAEALAKVLVHGRADVPEGVVYRVERHEPGKAARVDFLAKFVRSESSPGCFLPEVSGKPPVWQWPSLQGDPT